MLFHSHSCGPLSHYDRPFFQYPVSFVVAVVAVQPPGEGRETKKTKKKIILPSFLNRKKEKKHPLPPRAGGRTSERASTHTQKHKYPPQSRESYVIFAFEIIMSIEPSASIKYIHQPTNQQKSQYMQTTATKNHLSNIYEK